MKNILGHRSWNKKEVLDFLRRSGTFTMCSLPHYRYDRVKRVCRELAQEGLIERAGKDATGVNWRATEKLKRRFFLDGSDLV